MVGSENGYSSKKRGNKNVKKSKGKWVIKVKPFFLFLGFSFSRAVLIVSSSSSSSRGWFGLFFRGRLDAIMDATRDLQRGLVRIQAPLVRFQKTNLRSACESLKWRTDLSFGGFDFDFDFVFCFLFLFCRL